jgi:transposase, IS6 family
MINLGEKNMVKSNKEAKNPFKWKHFSGEVILWGVRWYGRYALSYQDLKEIFQERGLSGFCRKKQRDG